MVSNYLCEWERNQALYDLQQIAGCGRRSATSPYDETSVPTEAFDTNAIDEAACLADALSDAIGGGGGLGTGDQGWHEFRPLFDRLPRAVTAGLCNAYRLLERTYRVTLVDRPKADECLSEDPAPLRADMVSIAKSFPQSAIADIGKNDSQLPPSMYAAASKALYLILENDTCAFDAVEDSGSAFDPIWFGCYHWNDKTSPYLVALLLLNDPGHHVEWAYASCGEQITQLDRSLSEPLMRAFRHHYETGLLIEPSSVVSDPFLHPIPSLAASQLCR